MTAQEYGDWIPAAPTQDVGTRVLIDVRQSDMWQSAVDTIAGSGAEGRSARLECREMHEIVTRDMDQVRGQDPGNRPVTDEITDDMFGRSRHDADLLSKAGTIDQPAPLNGLFRHAPHVSGIDLLPSAAVFAAILLILAIIDAAGSDASDNWGVVALLAAVCLVAGGGSVQAHRVRRQDHLDLDVGPQIRCTDGTKRRTIEAGTNADLAELMRELNDDVPDRTDPLWDLYEQITDLAEEAAMRRAAIGPKELHAYNTGIAKAVARIDRELAHRRHRSIEQQKIRRELEHGTAGTDDEAAAGLTARLTQLDRTWDAIIPDSRPTDTEEERP